MAAVTPTPGGFAVVVKILSEDLGEPATGVNLGRFQRAILQALDELRTEATAYNLRDLGPFGEAGKAVYAVEDGLPAGLVRLAGHVRHEGERLRPVTAGKAQSLLASDDNPVGTPWCYAWATESLTVYPAPEADGTLSGRYLLDLGTPRLGLSSEGEWEYFIDGFPVDLEAWGNDWLIEPRPQRVVIARARYYYVQTYLSDAKRAQEALILYTEALASLRSEEAAKRTIGAVQPRLY